MLPILPCFSMSSSLSQLTVISDIIPSNAIYNIFFFITFFFFTLFTFLPLLELDIEAQYDLL